VLRGGSVITMGGEVVGEFGVPEGRDESQPDEKTIRIIKRNNTAKYLVKLNLLQNENIFVGSEILFLVCFVTFKKSVCVSSICVGLTSRFCHSRARGNLN
jgi:hypothetical protein